MLVMGVLDLAGVASVLPFLGVLANPQVIEKQAKLAWLYQTFGFETVTASCSSSGSRCSSP